MPYERLGRHSCGRRHPVWRLPLLFPEDAHRASWLPRIPSLYRAPDVMDTATRSSALAWSSKPLRATSLPQMALRFAIPIWPSTPTCKSRKFPSLLRKPESRGKRRHTRPWCDVNGDLSGSNSYIFTPQLFELSRIDITIRTVLNYGLAGGVSSQEQSLHSPPSNSYS